LCHARRIEVSRTDQRTNQKIEPTSSIGTIARQHTPEVSLGLGSRSCHVPPIKRQFRETQHGKWMRARLVKEGCRFRQSALTAAKFRKPYQSFGGHRRACRRQFFSRGQQFALGFAPCAAPHADRCILGAAHRKQRA